MNRNHITRLERLEETARRWKDENKVIELFEMDNKIVTPSTWTQKQGRKRGEPIEFETPRAALDWVTSQMTETAQATVYLDDVRDIMTEEERAIFELLHFDAPDHVTMFNLRVGTNVLLEAVRLWRHFLSGIKFQEWWGIVKDRYPDMLETPA